MKSVTSNYESVINTVRVFKAGYTSFAALLNERKGLVPLSLNLRFLTDLPDQQLAAKMTSALDHQKLCSSCLASSGKPEQPCKKHKHFAKRLCQKAQEYKERAQRSSVFQQSMPRGQTWIQPPRSLQTSHQLNITKWCPLTLCGTIVSPAKPGQIPDPKAPELWERMLRRYVWNGCYAGMATGTQCLLKEPWRSTKSLSGLCPSLLSEWLEFVHMAPGINIYQISWTFLTLKFEKIRIKITHTIKIEPEGPVHDKMSDMQKLSLLLISCSLHSHSPPWFP